MKKGYLHFKSIAFKNTNIFWKSWTPRGLLLYTAIIIPTLKY